MKRALIGHAAALLVTLAVLAASPFLANRMGSALSRLAGGGDGARLYALTWSLYCSR